MIMPLFILILSTLTTMITFPQHQIKKNYRSVTEHFPSVKNNKSITYASILILEFDKDVVFYQE